MRRVIRRFVKLSSGSMPLIKTPVRRTRICEGGTLRDTGRDSVAVAWADRRLGRAQAGPTTRVRTVVESREGSTQPTRLVRYCQKSRGGAPPRNILLSALCETRTMA